jgi:hypothetical protein
MQGGQQETQQPGAKGQQKSEQPAPKGQAQGQQPAQQQNNKQADQKKDAAPRAEGTNPQQPGQKSATPGAASKDQNTGKKADAPKADTSKNAETPRTDRQGTADSKSGNDKSATDKSADKSGTDKSNVQLSEKQRTEVHRDILKEKNVNRVNVNVQVRVGERLPRDVRLAPLPAAIVSIVPAYRSYRYFVVDDRVVIVDPARYEIVEVITESGQVATNNSGSGSQHLSLTAQEREIVIREIDVSSSNSSTLGIGALSEGADVPRNVELMEFPAPVLERVSKLRGYKYFVAEQRIAIVGQSGSKIELVIDAKQ